MNRYRVSAQHWEDAAGSAEVVTGTRQAEHVPGELVVFDAAALSAVVALVAGKAVAHPAHPRQAYASAAAGDHRVAQGARGAGRQHQRAVRLAAVVAARIHLAVARLPGLAYPVSAHAPPNVAGYVP
eukprot:8140434-Pyramimonas_sp.AAC.1